MHAVPGEVQDAPAVLVQGLHDRRGWLVDAVDDVISFARQLVGDGLRFLAGAGQVGEFRAALEIRVADDQRGVARAVQRALAEGVGAELADEAGGHRGRPFAVAPAVFQQFPRVAGRLAVDDDDHVALLRRQFAQAQRQQHFVERLGCLRVAPGIAAGRLHEGVGQGELAGGQGFLGACLVGREEEAQLVLLADDLQALVPLVGGIEAHATAPGLGGFDGAGRPGHGVGQRFVLQYTAEGFRGRDGDVLVEFEQFEAVDQHAAVEFLVGQRLVGGDGGAQHGFQRIADRQPAAAGADKQAGDSRRARPAGFAEAGIRPVGDLQRIVEQRVAHRGFELARAEAADFAEADDNGAHRLGDRRIVEKNTVAAEWPGVDAEVEPARQVAVQLAVEGGLGADHGIALVVADQHRMAGVGQVAVADADGDERGGALAFAGFRQLAGEAEAGDVLWPRDAIGRRGGRQHEAFFAGSSAGAGRRAARQQRGLAIDQDVEIGREGLGLGAQHVVRGVVDVPQRYAGQAAGGPGHGAVTLAGGDEFEALEVGPEQHFARRQLVVDDGGRLAARHVGHEARIGRGGLEEFPGGAGFLQVGGLGGVPAGAEFLAQGLPAGGVGEVGVIRCEGQQFEQAGVARHQVDDLLGALRDVEQAELGLCRVEAGQPAHGLVGAEVGGAEHQEAAARQLGDALPQRRAGAAIGDHRTDDQPAHRVGNQAQRLARAFGLGNQRLQRADQPGGGLAHREAPVVGEDLDLMAACQEFDQRPVERVDQPDRRDAVATHGDLLQAALEQRPVVQPDRIVAGR